MMETVLMRAFLVLYSSGFDVRDGDRLIPQSEKSSMSEFRALTLLSSVCSHWRYTLYGWPQSPTPHWVTNQLRKLIERSCRRFRPTARLQHLYDVRDTVWGVTQLHDVIYIVCASSSTIVRFNATTHQRLTDIEVVNGLRLPRDIAACERTSRLYIVDNDFRWECIWRVSADGAHIQRWLTRSSVNTFIPRTLSVTSSRLLVASLDTKQLRQFDAGGDELRRIDLPDDMTPCHAVESPTGTFIVSHLNTQLLQGHVSEVSSGGQVLRQFSRSHLRSLSWPEHIAVDSDGNILVAVHHSRHVLLLNSQLQLRRVIIDQHQLNDKRPRRLCYIEQSGQLLVGFNEGSVAVFDVLRRAV